LQDKKVVVLANLKPRNMRGVKSSGMLMAASDASHENVELLVPPEDSLPGERIWFGSEEEKENQPAAATANQVLILLSFEASIQVCSSVQLTQKKEEERI
jgi:aminoacyl tRNA synthase complex-interacting multifunctional protein 1